MTSIQKDGLVYLGSSIAGVVLAKSFGAKFLGLAMGGTAGIALAAWTILNRTTISGEKHAYAGYTNPDANWGAF